MRGAVVPRRRSGDRGFPRHACRRLSDRRDHRAKRMARRTGRPAC